MRAEVIVLGHLAPMRVDHRGPVFARADAVFPMVFVGETPARPAQDGDFAFLQRGHDVVANAASVRNRAVFLHPIALVNAAAQVFGEMTVDVAVDGGLGVTGAERELGGVLRSLQAPEP